MTVLRRYAFKKGIWIETGTYLGKTTAALARKYPAVYSIEPKKTLYEKTRRKLKAYQNIHLFYGPSEKNLQKIVQNIHGPINFWLDGHFSGGTKYKTFKGKHHSPIKYELSVIQKNLRKFHNICIFIDDVRDFIKQNKPKGYIEKKDLVNWCEKNKMVWNIEHDIFIAKKTK